jgi:hypothetical protein
MASKKGRWISRNKWVIIWACATVISIGYNITAVLHDLNYLPSTISVILLFVWQLRVTNWKKVIPS